MQTGDLKLQKKIYLKALEGNWRNEQLFNLRMAWEHYKFLLNQLAQCDKKSNMVLSKFETIENKEVKDTNRRTKNQPTFNIKNYLFQVLGSAVYSIRYKKFLLVKAQANDDHIPFRNDKHVIIIKSACRIGTARCTEPFIFTVGIMPLTHQL
jgi:hypothetical protein